MRRLLRVVVICTSVLVLGAGSAGAATPPLKAQFAPLNLRIKKIGNDIGTSITSADKQTDLQLAKAFAGLAQRTAGVTISVTKLKGASGATLNLQRQLALALAKGATDLAAIATAAEAHSAPRAKAATITLIKDSKPIVAARTALAKALGVPA
jgi:hypothetical protein